MKRVAIRRASQLRRRVGPLRRAQDVTEHGVEGIRCKERRGPEEAHACLRSVSHVHFVAPARLARFRAE